MTLEGEARPQGCLAEPKKPEHCQDYDDQTNNVYESIHDLTCEWERKVCTAALRMYVRYRAFDNRAQLLLTAVRPWPTPRADHCTDIV